MKQGFTLIELLITIVIGGIMLSGGLAAYRGLGTRQQVKQAGVSFQTDLKSYQQKALAGIKPAECLVGETLSGYQVSYIDASHYSVGARCSQSEPAAATVSLPNLVVFALAFNPVDIFFPVLQGQVAGAQTITLTKTSYQYSVVIEPSGVIRGQML